jgi:protein-S-isoprenylcysteine O-methyltransferase Ste14
VTELQIHNNLILTTFAAAALTFISLLCVTAPYGRHHRPGWGPTIPARVGWVVMESPAVLFFGAVYWVGDHAQATLPLILFGLWQFHYINRTFIFPFRMRSAGKRMPLAIVAMAIFFNCLNAYINARWISHFGDYQVSRLATLPFAFGFSCFLIGWTINQYADTILFRLRQLGESGYRIPHGGMYRWISCPNYFGEMLQWAGWAIATWSLAGAAFAVFTVANLLPRALANHRWYKQVFADYPPSRRAVIPGFL